MGDFGGSQWEEEGNKRKDTDEVRGLKYATCISSKTA
jgi:hypothetical protein